MFKKMAQDTRVCSCTPTAVMRHTRKLKSPDVNDDSLSLDTAAAAARSERDTPAECSAHPGVRKRLRDGQAGPGGREARRQADAQVGHPTVRQPRRHLEQRPAGV